MPRPRPVHRGRVTGPERDREAGLSALRIDQSAELTALRRLAGEQRAVIACLLRRIDGTVDLSKAELVEQPADVEIEVTDLPEREAVRLSLVRRRVPRR